ncbi:MAG: isoleucine--tRNA ligase [Proteobacteria bacterium]|nr:MAG: isoleucine--tRNA ligase [Pseudomonadota bacterium]
MSQENTVSEPSSEPSASGHPNFVKIEHEILEFWQREESFSKLQRKLQGKPIFRFLDGPITANNPMGVHHAWGRTLKDIYIRYNCLQGFDSPFQNGFDCQGLWVEVEVEKDLGFNGKPDIESYGLDKFSEACKARIKKFSHIQTQQSIRLGQWMDWSNSYYTHTDHNIEGIWKVLKRCHEQGWLYKSHLSMPWCTRCGTSLSEHEMTGSYKDMSHLAVYIKLLVPKLNARILVWTTTPWTLPANTALAVHPDLHYSIVQIDGQDAPLLLSSDVLKNWQSTKLAKKKHEVLKGFRGRELVGLDFEPIFNDIPVQTGFDHKIVPWELVDPKEGTGVVHIAPGCGKEDFELSNQIGLTKLVPIDEAGNYVKGYGHLEGKNVKQVGEEVAAYLDKGGKLYAKYQHEHSYPICWRCKDELVFRLVDEWYISTEEIRPKLIEAARQVTWQPEHIGKRMEDWLNNMGDWCISRKRFWGLPLPFYPCECGHLSLIGSRQELEKLSGSDLSSVPELHRPWIDTVKIKCPSCSKPVTRVTEVGDCWLDAGITPFSTIACYDKGKTQPWHQADFICEMSEQVRLWFYSMLFMGVTLESKPPYKRVLTYERVLAETGAKFSKTGYMIKFDEAAEKMGVDTMRYYFASQPPTSDLRFGYARGDETRRQLISLWNIYQFFMTYAEIDRPDLSAASKLKEQLLPVDRWLLASTSDFVRQARLAYKSYNTPAVTKEFESFCEGVSNWYIRSNRRRFWKSENTSDKLIGYFALFEALRAVTVVMSPITPFVTEKIWQSCIRKFDPAAPESVHHSSWPEVPDSYKNDPLLAQVAKVRSVLNLAHRLRAESQLKVRQPLNTLYLYAPDDVSQACRDMSGVILNEVNVKNLSLLKDKAEMLSKIVELDLKKAGPVLKGDVAKVVQIVNGIPPELAEEIAAKVEAQTDITLPGYEDNLPAGIFVTKVKNRSNTVSCEEAGVFAALDTTVTRELEVEGWIREILRQSQVLRKDSGLQVEDRINISLQTSANELSEAIRRYSELIEDETLGALSTNPLEKPLGQTKLELPSGTVEISLSKRA